ncbi:hypothetical protein [Phytoactinopolyspora mesophila]|uniref:Uncharacterized protein n=1 Tax=Phytoactinopolyspora mesophila TaxID=2650750 RepID=A0A7K3M7A8_9ACTN|nr:hypothetical protein [Phytoactinopolyspora mesophila]NDL59165.1 hypothetical protein [Phytoactinopolyspora mesophila]
MQTTTTRPTPANRLRSFVHGGASLAASAAAVSLFVVGFPLASASAALEPELVAEHSTTDSPPPEIDVEQAFPDDGPVNPPNWGPDGIKPCEVNCNPGGDEDGGGEDGNGEDGNGEDGNEDGGNDGGNDENGGDDGTDDVPEHRTPVPTRIDAGEGGTDGDYLWLALGGVLSAVGLSTLGYRSIRNQQ